MKDRLLLSEGYWFAWQMIPGYACERSVPYCSPIFVDNVTPLKTGKSRLRLGFQNVLYAAGVQSFQVDLAILKHSADYLVAEIRSSDKDRCAVISHIEFGWIRRFCPELWERYPPGEMGGGAATSVTLYLHEIFDVARR